MSPQNQVPHFPCGPCPLLEAINTEITRYEALRDNFVIAEEYWAAKGKNPPRINIRLHLAILTDNLQSLYNLAEAHLTENTSIEAT